MNPPLHRRPDRLTRMLEGSFRKRLGRVGVALMVIPVLLWVGLMLALVVPVAAVDWLYQRIRRLWQTK